MGALTLEIIYSETGVKKTMKFEPNLHVHDVVKIIKDKLGVSGNSKCFFLLFRRCFVIVLETVFKLFF